MKPTEIIDSLKKLLLSDEKSEQVETPVEEVALTEEAKETEVIEEVVLAEDEKPEEVKDEETPEGVIPEDPAAEVEEEAKYATKEDLNQAIAKLSSMIEQLNAAMSPEKPTDVPAELSADVPELVHNPEGEVEKKPMNLHSQRRAQTTKDTVFAKLFKD